MVATNLDVATVEDTADDVPIVLWPREAARREDLARARRARLLIVADHRDPPVAVDELEDWVREGVDPVEVYSRRELLRRRQARRAPAVLDGDGLLHRGPGWVAVSPMEQRVLVPLLARAGEVVSRSELLGAAYPDRDTDPHRSVDRVIRRLRLRVAPLGLRVHAVRGTGFLLDMGVLRD